MRNAAPRGRRMAVKTPPTLKTASLFVVASALSVGAWLLLDHYPVSILVPAYYAGLGAALVGAVPSVRTFRRIMFNQTTFLLLTLPFQLVAAYASSVGGGFRILLGLVFLPVVAVVSILYITVLRTALNVALKASVPAGAGLALTYTAAFKGSNISDALYVVITVVAFSIAMRFGLSNIRVGPMNGLAAIEAFSKSWMDRQSHAFDAVMAKLGRSSRIRFTLHRFEGGKGPVVTLVVPYAHPGPAGNMGSGDLPCLLYNKLATTNPVVFHGVSNHDHNIAARSDVEKLADALAASDQWIEQGPFNSLSYSSETVGRVSATNYRFGDHLLTFLSKPNNTEDLPESARGFVSHRRDVVDRHNGLCNEADALFNATDEAHALDVLARAEHISGEQISVTGVGYHSVNVASPDVGPGGVRAVVFTGDKNVTIVSVDANNLACELSSKIEARLKAEGFTIVEVVTTDNHWNSGGAGSLGYRPGGSADPEALVEACLTAATAARAASQPASYKKASYEFDTTLLGDSGLRLLLSGLRRGEICVAALSIAAYITTALLVIF
ncbi:MAG: DUF2070 family protein [Thermoprotei archaeon]